MEMFKETATFTWKYIYIYIYMKSVAKVFVRFCVNSTNNNSNNDDSI